MLLIGKIAAAAVRGIQSADISACPKHFACNNQEVNRNRNDSRVSQRALREIYLKGFEICIKESSPRNLMTSYNKINGVWSHYNYDLATMILRSEWGYEGNIVTDWWMQRAASPEFPKVKDNAYRVRSQVDVLMPGGLSPLDRKYVFDKKMLSTLGQKGGLTRAELQRTAMTIEFFVKGQGMTYQEGLSAGALATSPMMLLSVLATIIMVLSDRIGRKPMLLASGIGIAIGTLIIYASPNFSVYLVGSAFVTFFISFDMHQLYIVEVAPESKRATWQAYSSFFSQMAIVFIGVLRLLNTTDAVSTALIFSPIAMGFTRLSAGFASDKLGRKKASTIYSIATVVGLVIFIMCVKSGMSAVLVGILMGVTTGSYWTVGDQIGLMMNESAPTNIRGSVTAAAGLLQVVVAIVAMVFAGIMIAFADLALFCVIYGVIILGIATLALMFKVKETNGIDLSANDLQ